MVKYTAKYEENGITSYRNFEIYHTKLFLQGIDKPLRILLGSDVHLSELDARDGVERRRFMAQRRLWFPFATDILDEITLYPASQPVDFSVLLGDIIDFPSDKNLETLQTLRRPEFGPYLYICGNHDDNFPEEKATDEERAKYRDGIDAFARDRLNRYADVTPEVAKIPQGCFHAVNLGEVIIAGGNNVTDVGKKAMTLGVNALKALQKPVILCVHLPFYSDTLAEPIHRVWGSVKHSMLGQDPLVDAVFAEDSVVSAVFAGDVHFFHNDIAEGKIPQIIVSSQEKKIRTGTDAEKFLYWSGLGIVDVLPLEKE